MGRKALLRPPKRGSGAVNCGTGTKNNLRLSFTLSTAVRLFSLLPYPSVSTQPPPPSQSQRQVIYRSSAAGHVLHFHCERAPDYAALVFVALRPARSPGGARAPTRSHGTATRSPRFVYHRHTNERSERRRRERRERKQKERRRNEQCGETAV